MTNGGGDLARRLRKRADHYEAMAKWASMTPQEEWRQIVRENPNPAPPYVLPPYVFVKVGFGMNVKQLKYETKVLYQRHGRNPRFAEHMDLPFPPGTTEDEIVFVCPEPGMNTTRLAWKVVDVQIALEEQVDFPNNLTPEQRASLDDPDANTTKPGLNARIAAARADKERERIREAVVTGIRQDNALDLIAASDRDLFMTLYTPMTDLAENSDALFTHADLKDLWDGIMDDVTGITPDLLGPKLKAAPKDKRGPPNKSPNSFPCVGARAAGRWV
jgi:hypothetical protein